MLALLRKTPAHNGFPFTQERRDLMERAREQLTLLRSAAIGPLELPFVHAPCLEHSPDQIDEHRIIDPAGQEAKQDVMVDVVEEPANIHFDQPFRTRPGFADLFESRVAGATRAEPMTVLREHRLINRRENHSRRLLNDAIIRRRDAQWAHFTIALWDIDPPHWTRAVTAFRHAFDQTIKPRQRHAVEGLAVYSRRHGTPIPGYPVIRPLI